MSRIRLPMFIVLGASVLFSLLQFSFHADISLLAFPLSLAMTFFSVWFLFIKLYGKKEFKAVLPTQKMLQYLPYVFLASFVLRRAGKNGTPYWYDVVTVVLWAVVLACRYLILHFLNEKRAYLLEPSWKNEKKGKSLLVKPAGFKRVLFELADWIDAVVQAVFMVLIFQIFVLQLYVIPSESMVPSFLIGDRVIVFKTPSGPKMPLSDVGFPCLKSYRRGDVVVFRNPHYSMDRKSEIRTVVSQIVYMLTFSTVNLNVDENGEPKADPLVKRVTGLPGEQLVMQDGTLYARTKKSDNFEPVELDKKYAAWNLNVIHPSIRKGIETIPLSKEQYAAMLDLEKVRRELDIDSVAFECSSISKRFSEIAARQKKEGDFSEPSLLIYDVFSNSFERTMMLLKTKGGSEWFSMFMTDWISGKSAAESDFSNDIYKEANFRLNLMAKLSAGRIYLRTAEILSKNGTAAELSNDELLQKYFEDAEKIHFYSLILDQRNMPLFPENLEDGTPQYIAEGSYFMMGDNRFNSLDMRHSYEKRTVPLSSYDKYSVKYRSNMEPQYVSKRYILGLALYRFWPLTRRGVVRTR